jgi:hypothetical protein
MSDDNNGAVMIFVFRTAKYADVVTNHQAGD